MQVRTKDMAMWMEKEKLIEDIVSSSVRTINTYITFKSTVKLVF